MRIVAACIVSLLATSAAAKNFVIENARVQYTYSYNVRGPLRFCDLATTIAKAPIVIKLTAAFITDDTKPKNRNLSVMYIVEAFVVDTTKSSSKLEPKQIKVVAGRIISDIFNTDLHASKNVDKDMGASYAITSEGSLALFTNVLTVRGTYTLAVELENNSSLIVDVKPTSEFFDPTEKWNKCGIAIMEHRPPQ